MSEVTPPPTPPPTSPQTPASAAQQPTVTVPNPPQALTELALGARLDAVIAAASTASQGRIEIDTAFGRLPVQTGFPLPTDGPLQLQLLAKGPQLLLLITAIHGLPPAQALRQLGLSPANIAGGGIPGTGAQSTGAATTPGGVGTPAAPGAGPGGIPGGVPGGGLAPGAVRGEPTPVNLTVGATLAATLLKAGPPGPGTAPGQAAPAGAPQAGAAAPGAVSSTASGATTGTAQGAAAGTSTGPVPGAAAQAGSPAAALPPGTLFSVRITGFQPAAAEQGALPQPLRGGALAPGGQLSGVVTGNAQPSGHPVVQTHAGLLTVATRTPLPPGSTIAFEVLSQAPALESAGPATLHAARPMLSLTGRWPALEESVRALAEVNPALAQQLVHAVLPRPGVTLAANVLFFLVALTGGGLRGWMGDGPARALERLRPDLMARLREDIGQMGRVAEDRTSGDWRTLPIPFFNGADIEQFRLSLRRFEDEPDDDNEEGRQGTRFVIDLDLSRLGRFQLDGLVYQKEKHMDLIVRTENKLPPRVQDDIRGIFENAGEATGIKGGIAFQAAPPNFVEVTRPPAPDAHLGLIV